jgi:hypothetical protein
MADSPSIAGEIEAPHWEGADALAQRLAQLFAKGIPVANLKVSQREITVVTSVQLVGDLIIGYDLIVGTETLTVLVPE